MDRCGKITITVLLILGFALPQPAFAWVSKRAKDQTRYTIPFKPKWVSRLKKGAFYKYKRRELSTPIAANGLILVGVDSGYFYAFDAVKGHKKWRFEAEASINSEAGAGLNKVFFGDDDGNFYALEIESGTLLWKQRYGAPVTAAPLVIGDRIYFVTVQGDVFAADAGTGNRIWSHPHDSVKREMTILGEGAISYYGDGKAARLYLGFSDGHLVAMNPGDGSVVWDRDLTEGQYRFIDVDMRPLIEGDRIYAATFSGYLFCLDRQKGQVVWKAQIGSGTRFSASADHLIVSGSDGVLYALNKADGSILWQYDSGDGALSRPLIYHNLIAVGSTEHSMLFVDALNGHKFLQRFARKNIYSDPILAGPEQNILVYLSNAGRLYALKLKDKIRK